MIDPSAPPLAPPSVQQQQQQKPIVLSPQNTWDVFVENNEIKPDASADLLSVLSDTKIVLLLDDSGSMSTRVVDPGASAFALSAGGVQATRWSELEKLTASVVDMLTAAPTAEKMDAYFLNRGKHLNVSDRSQIAPFFSQGPRGGTPLCGSLRRIFDAYQADMQAGRRVLVIVITDGEPSDGGVDDLFSLMESALKYGRNKDKLFVSFAECNDNEEEMAYLDGWDTRLPHFDNTDDFPMEALRVKAAQRARGERQRFTYVDYVIKIVLGAVLRKYWNMDQIGAKGPVYGATSNRLWSSPAPPAPPAAQQMIYQSPPTQQSYSAAPPPTYAQSQRQQGILPPQPAFQQQPIGVIAVPQQPPVLITSVAVPQALVSTQPQTKEGSISKRGSLWPSWKKRRFVFTSGYLTYYDGNAERGVVRGLNGVEIVSNMQLTVRGDRAISLRFDSPYDQIQWKQAIEDHIRWNKLSS